MGGNQGRWALPFLVACLLVFPAALSLAQDALMENFLEPPEPSPISRACVSLAHLKETSQLMQPIVGCFTEEELQQLEGIFLDYCEGGGNGLVMSRLLREATSLGCRGKCVEFVVKSVEKAQKKGYPTSEAREIIAEILWEESQRKQIPTDLEMQTMMGEAVSVSFEAVLNETTKFIPH